ncbi:hypothetical protein M9434_003872 [Picochlorum sp. BPE23]|nr:hypothetical protein M9434_003872 [Picochlorum sp. BPE23]
MAERSRLGQGPKEEAGVVPLWETSRDVGIWSGCFGLKQPHGTVPALTGGGSQGKSASHHRRKSSFTRWFSSLQLNPGVGQQEDAEDSRASLWKDNDDIILNYQEADMAKWTSDLLDDGYSHKNVVAVKEEQQQHRLSGESPRAISGYDDVSGSDSITIASSTVGYQDSLESNGKRESGGHHHGDQSVPERSMKKKSYKSLWNPMRRKQGAEDEDTCSVTALKGIVMSLKSRQAIAQSAQLREKLLMIDSRAFAALLKDLSKNGAAQQSWYLFDYIRAVPEGDELYEMADLYTYTTVISQCGAHRKLQKALDMFEEMKSRGIQCNIHTYSALMGVCVKHNECNRAIEMYEELLQTGCEPNLVTFNILIDAYNKIGKLEESVKVLDDIKAHKLLPEARTYNSIISACGKACLGGLALQVYEQMIHDGVGPTNTTYTSAISACGRSGMVNEALALYREMPSHGCQPNVITYSSLISVCERAGNATLAISMFQEMIAKGVDPNIVTYNGLLGTFARSGEWQNCLKIFNEMSHSKCMPDSTSYSALIAALSRGSQWKEALEYYSKSQAQGLRIEHGAYMLLLGCLWSTGRWPVQRKAFQMFSDAQKTGAIKMRINTTYESTVVADTSATSCLAVIKWLTGYKQGLTGAMQNPLKTLVLIPGKFCAPDGSKEDVYGALKALFSSYCIPAEVYQTNRGNIVKADARMIATWASSGPGYLIHSMCNVENGPNQQVSTVLKDDSVAFAQCQKAFLAVKDFEYSQKVFTSAVKADITQWRELRGHIIENIIHFGGTLNVREELCHDAVQLCDRLLALGIPSQQPPSPACAAALLLLSCRQAGSAHIVLKNEQILLHSFGLPLSAVLDAETWVMTTLGREPAAISPLRVLSLYFELLGFDGQTVQKNQFINSIVVTATDVLSRATIQSSHSFVPPSLMAAACLCVSYARMGMVPVWPSSLSDLTGYSTHDPMMQECMFTLQQYVLH